MIYDYCEIEKYIHPKVNLNFGILIETGTVIRGNVYYALAGLNQLDVIWNDKTRILRIRGSLAYHFLGHNFTGTAADIREGWQFIGDRLGINLFDAWVTAFEVGEILQVPFDPQSYFSTHIRVKGMKSKILDFGRYFENKVLKVKIYDVGKRLKQVLTVNARNELQTDLGYQPNANYIRLENHYKKPEIYFKQSPIFLDDLTDESFQERCKSDLLLTYESIIKSKSIEVQRIRHSPSVSDLFLITLKRLEADYHFDTKAEVQKTLLTISYNILSKENRKKRKQKINEDLKRISTEACASDLTELLINKLNRSN